MRVIKPKKQWIEIVKNIINKSGTHGYHLALVLIGVKEGDWIEYTTPHIKWVISQIEELISLGAPLAFLEPDEVERVKTLQFEDFSDLIMRVDSKEAINISNKGYPFVGIKYHNTGIPKKILSLIKEKYNGITLGFYFGYPDCCIEAHMYNKAGPIKPYTEHKWCAPDCSASIKLQEIYEYTLRILFPSHLKLGPCFNKIKKKE